MAGRQLVNVIRRPTLFSVVDSEQLAVESSRARQIKQITNTDVTLPKDFTAYFHSSTKNSYPTTVFTSHHSKKPLVRRRTVLPTYPCIQSLRWNPCVEASSVNEDSDITGLRPNPRPDLRPDMKPNMRPGLKHDMKAEEPKYNCRCKSCAMKKCLSTVPSYSAVRSPVFRNNIMTFCDQHTMTPRLNEVGCGSKPVLSTQVSNVPVNTLNKAVKDTQASMHMQQFYSPEKCPAFILKKDGEIQAYCPSNSDSQCFKHFNHSPMNYHPETERDIDKDYTAPSIISSVKSFFSGCKTKKDRNKPRRIIYNEGISDLVANRIPVPPVKVPYPINLKKECSKTSVRSRNCINEGIPYSHRTDSRYHDNCKKSNYHRSFYGDLDEVKHLVASPNIVRKLYASKPGKHHKVPCIRMPKRVLTSEWDIESYIDREYSQDFKPDTRRQSRN